ncbi:MAG: hypothetical protein ACI4F9_05210 [Lachnospiraceae bacterium]
MVAAFVEYLVKYILYIAIAVAGVLAGKKLSDNKKAKAKKEA